MANFQNTILLNALSMLTDKANKDLRAPAYGATQAFNDLKRDVILNFDAFRASDKSGLRTLQVDYLRRDTDTVNSSRSASLTGKMGTSKRDTLTFVTYAREFTISDDVAKNNTMNAARQLASQIRNARLDIGASIEDAMITKLEAFKNQVQGGRNLGTWDGTNFLMSVANASEDRYFNIIEAEMQMLDYNGPLQLINFGSLNETRSWQAAQGAANTNNLQFQYQGKTFYTANRITNSSDHVGTSYAVEEGAIALVDWIPGKNETGLMNHAEWDFMAIPDPFNIFDRMALAVQKSVADSTGISGDTQDAVWKYELSLDVAAYIPTITTQKLVNKYVLSKS